MPGNFRRLICRCALVAIALLASVRLAPTSVSAAGDIDGSIWRPMNVAWPAGLTSAAEDAAADIVSAVTADIDADGDLDVVATDQSLNLLVWVNDGTGHLTRQWPRHSGGESTSPGSPTLERRAPSIAFSTFSDPPSAGLEQRPDFHTGRPDARPPVAADPPLPFSTTRHTPPRAPPSGTSLT